MPRDLKSQAALTQVALGSCLSFVAVATGMAPLAAMVTAATSVGANVLATYVDRAHQEWCASWFTEQGLLNHDIAWAVYQALAEAVKQIERDWNDRSKTAPYRDEQRREAHGALRLMREEALALAKDPAGIMSERQLKMFQLLGEKDLDDSLHLIDQDIEEWLHGYETEFVAYVKGKVPSLWLQRFKDLLKGSGDKNTRAWRAYQLLWQTSLLKAVKQENTAGQVETAPGDIAKVKGWLDDWGNKLASLPERQRDPTGEAALDAAVSEVLHRLELIQAQLDRLQGTADQVLVHAIDIERKAGERHDELLASTIRSEGRLIIAIEQAVSAPRQGGSAAPAFKAPSFRGECVGREEALAQIDRLLGEVGAAVAVTGPPGVGKTMVAAAYVYGYRERFAGGVFWMDDAARGWRNVAGPAGSICSAGRRRILRPV
jgi:hypothetical protein